MEQRARLREKADTYLKSMTSGDTMSLHIHPSFRYTKNGQVVQLGAGAWLRRGEIQFTRHVLDETLCSTLSQAVMKGVTGRFELAVRPRYTSGELIEAEAQVVPELLAATDLDSVIAMGADPFVAEVPQDKRMSRDDLFAFAHRYFDAVTDTSSLPPSAAERRRLQNGIPLGDGTCTEAPGTMRFEQQRFDVADELNGIGSDRAVHRRRHEPSYRLVSSALGCRPMPNIYANNAGTSWPKAPGVIDAACAAISAPPASSQHVFQAARDEVCHMLGIEQPERLLLAGGCTAALSLALSDLPLRAGDVVLISALEHHALARPLQQLVLTRGIELEISPYAPGHPFDLEHAERLLRGGRVRLVAVTGASNVTGELLPVTEIGELARAHGVPVLLDAAQTLGVVPIDLRSLPVDIIVFAGHKGPLAPHGIGGLWAAPSIAFESPAAVCEINPTSKQPHCSTFPGDCDVGSANLGAVAGLAAALSWRHKQAADPYAKPRQLATRLRDALRDRPGCRVFGGTRTPHTAAVSFLIDPLPLAAAEAHFAQRGITLRAGQHCAPLALQAIGAPNGTLRASFGPFNEDSDVDAILAAVDDATNR